MVSYPNGHPNQPGQWGAPIAPGYAPSITRSTRRAKWLMGAAIAVLVFVTATIGTVAVTNHTQRAGSPSPTAPPTIVLQQWWAGAHNDFTEMQNASQDVDQAFRNFRPGALAAACQHVHDAAEVWMQSHLPSPNPELTAELHAAVEDFHSAAHMCLAAAAGSTINYDAEFFSLMRQANMHMRAAHKIINQLLTNV